MRDKILKIGIVICIVWISLVLGWKLGYVQSKGISVTDDLYLLARDKNSSNIQNGYIMHNGTEYGQRASKYSLGKIGENLYKGNTCDIGFAVKLWQESAPHKVILDSGYNRAILVVQRSGEDCYATLEVQN